MDIQDLKLGNLIKISPRENEEGVLFLVDIQHSSIIGEMITPRQGYHFRIKFDEILPLEPSEYWLEQLGFTKVPGSEEIWTDENNFIQFKLSALESGILEGDRVAVTIDSMHQLQNIYQTITGQPLAVVRLEM
jgi:hypothetical protein